MSKKAPHHDVGDPELVKVDKAQKRNDADRKVDSLRRMLRNPDYREVVWDLLIDCHVFHQSWQGSTEGMLINEGKRHIGLDLLTKVMTADDQAYITMQREDKARQTRKG